MSSTIPSSSTVPTIEAPADQIAAAIVAGLQGGVAAADAGQIRRALDLSGEYKGACGIVVNVADLGAFENVPNRALISVEATVTCYSHLEADLDGSALRQVVAQAMNALASLTYALQGWAVALPNGYGNYSASATTTDGSYRQVSLTATQYLYRTVF